MTPVQLGQTPKQQMRRLELLQWQEQRQEQQAAEEASATAAAAGAATSSAALPNPVGAAHGRGGVQANAGRKRTRFGPPTLAEFKSSVDKLASSRPRSRWAARSPAFDCCGST